MTYTIKSADMSYLNCVMYKIKNRFINTLFSFLAAVFAVAAFFIYFTEFAYARQAKSISSSPQAVRSSSDYGGGLDFGYGYKDMTEAKRRPFAKPQASGVSRYKSSYAGAGNSLRTHLASAIVLFCTFIIISVIGFVHYLRIKSSNKSEFDSSSLPAAVSSFNLSAGSDFLSISRPDGSVSSAAASSSQAFSGTPIGGAKLHETGEHDLYRLYERVKEVFKLVQRSWSERDLSAAEKYMSRRFFYGQQRRLEDMTAKGERDIITNIEIIDVKIIEIKSGAGNDAGYMKALIKFSMINYTINESGGSVVRGDEYVPVESSELWSFVHGDNGWLVDELFSSMV